MFRSTTAVKNVLPTEVQRRLDSGESLQIIDVREAYEVARGKIPNARNIRLSEIPRRLGEIDRNREVIVVCLTGARSAAACHMLAGQGFSTVSNMVGGMSAWRGPVA